MRYFYTILMCTMCCCIAQSQPIGFDYDDSGNMEFRSVLTLKSAADESISFPQFITEKSEEFQINIYPNPFGDELKFDISGLTDDSEIYIFIYDSNGNPIKQIHDKPTESMIVNLSDLLPGSYILSVQLENEKFSWKLVKE